MKSNELQLKIAHEVSGLIDKKVNHTTEATWLVGRLFYGLSIKYIRKIFQKTNISEPLIRTRTCAYQGVRNVSFSENFAYVLNG